MTDINIKKVDIKSIVPADYNPRYISDDEFSRLRLSLNEFGMVDPIIVNLKDNTIIGGHQRYSVLLKDHTIDELNLIELGDVGWAFTDTDLTIKDKTHEKSLNIALNKISGEFDMPKLNDLLEELSYELDDLEITGFTYADASEIAKELQNSIEDLLDDDFYDDDMIDSLDITSDNSLKEDYIMPPFTVLSQADEDWKNMKKGWLELIERDVDKHINLIESYPQLSLDPVLAEILISWFSPNIVEVNILDCFGDDIVFGYVSNSKGLDCNSICHDEYIKSFKDSLFGELNKSSLELNDESTYDLMFSYISQNNTLIGTNDYILDDNSEKTYKKDIKLIKENLKNNIKKLNKNRFSIVVCDDVFDDDGFVLPLVEDIIKLFDKEGLKLYNKMIFVEDNGLSGLHARNSFEVRKVSNIHKNVLVFFNGNVEDIKQEFL